MALSKKNRLSPARSVAKVVRGRAVSQTDHFALKVERTGNTATAVAIVVPSKVVSRATERNSVRRRVSESIRPLMSRIRPSVNAVIIVRREDVPHLTDLHDELTLLLQKSDMLRQ